LKGLKAAVTGGTRGIGHAILGLLADEGCDVSTCGRAPERVAAVQALLAEKGVRHHAETVQGRDGSRPR